jgi:hypothetical protein
VCFDLRGEIGEYMITVFMWFMLPFGIASCHDGLVNKTKQKMTNIYEN